ncbi:MAG: hypothetical protein ORN28_10055 [Rhodoferax sp.]|nr:hypothetical protein [Rhodoferax sp.]
MPRYNFTPYNRKRLTASLWMLRVFMVVFFISSPLSFYFFHRMSLQPVVRDTTTPSLQKIIDWQLNLLGFASVDSFIQVAQYLLPLLLVIAASLIYWIQNKVKAILG